MPESESRPKENFRGWHIPVEVVKYFQNGKINAIETLLLATVDSLVSEKKGCFASNKYLGEKMGVSRDSISRMLTKLKDLGLVKQIKFNGRTRNLETAWSKMNTLPRRKRRNSLGENAEAESASLPKPNRVYKDSIKRRGGHKKSPPPRKGFLSSDFDTKAAGRLREILVLNDADLVQPPNRVRVDTLAKSIFSLRTERKASESEIKSIIKWLKVAYSDVHTPKLHKANGLFKDWGRFKEARKGWIKDNPEEADRHGFTENNNQSDNYPLIQQVRKWMRDDHNWDMNQPAGQEDVDEALVAMGYNAGEVSEDDV